MTPVERQLAPPGGWIDSGPLRIEPVLRNQMRLWERVAVWIALKFRAPRSANVELPMVFAVLRRNGRLFWPWLRFASKLMPYGTLDRRDAELVILRVGWNCRSRYEWGQHVEIGLQAGLHAEQIARVPQGPEASGWEPRQAALLHATDELHRNRVISDSTWLRLAQHYRPSQLIEISMLVGHYEMLAGFLNSVGLGLEPPVENALAQAPIHGPDSGR